ncbi:YfbU family protein [Mesorhizobium sp. M2D.F.Ca.ET.232.01.1.1]|uniref:YfbU family protein n=1 Tax=Mesorhizobium sp. M2D.F.Ca.ET.232.01.1.1 TaxID=2496670 RepID=UPI001FE024A8|nr:YfbU family protein [Mesorhizobium sp. M2D.F.Ca.ET.232.01.1.1]
MEMRLDPVTIDRVDDWRGKQGDLPTRSEAIRRLVDRGLASTGSVEFRLDGPQQLSTWLLTKILEKVDDGENAEDIKLIQQVLLGGHYWALEWEMNGVLHQHEDDRRIVTEVVNTLDMWNFIETACEALSKEDRKHLESEAGPNAKNPRFLGYDGNNESEHMHIAQFLVKEMGRFQRFKDRDFNSHSPTVDRYRRMYGNFEPKRAGLVGRELTVYELIPLLRRT